MIHEPFDTKTTIGCLFSWGFWIMNILQILSGVLVVFFDEINWVVSESTRTLAFWNVIIGATFIISRVIVFVIEDYKTSKKKVEEIMK